MEVFLDICQRELARDPSHCPALLHVVLLCYVFSPVPLLKHFVQIESLCPSNAGQ